VNSESHGNKRNRLTGLAVLPLLVVSFLPASAVHAQERPDLSGTYDVATLTPLQRPERFADKKTITPEEAEAIAAYWATNLAKDSENSDPNREAPEVGGTEFAIPEFSGAAGGVGGYNAFYVDIGESNFQIDGEYRTSIIVDPPSGRRPPLSEQGREAMAAMAGFFRENTGTAWWLDMPVGPYDDPELRPLGERCILGFGSTAGPPALPVMYNNMKRIVQTDDYVMILNEMNHDARIIRIDGEHQPSSMRSWLGDSIGHWEGDTLVVDTTNFREQAGLSGASEDLHVVEKFSRIDAETLLYQFTVSDPNWASSWSGEYPWPASDNQVYEYACHEGNYALGGILRGARLLEAEALAEQDAGEG
jgi:hypothetical protein